jgi:hypothetical protein
MHDETPLATERLRVGAVVALETELRSRLRGQVSGLRVVQRDAGLVLQGCSRSYYAKQLAQHNLMRATSLPLVANEIAVDA